MVRINGKFFLILLLAISLIGLSGCQDKDDKATNKNNEKKTVTDVKKDDSKKTETEKKPQNEEKAVQDLVKKDTHIVQISNISKRTNPTFPDMGPFYVVRGMDYRGQVHEIWIKDMKIYEMTTQKQTP